MVVSHQQMSPISVSKLLVRIVRRLIVRVKDLETAIFRCEHKKNESLGVKYFGSWENQLFVGYSHCVNKIETLIIYFLMNARTATTSVDKQGGVRG
jgi:hypothetical protein